MHDHRPNPHAEAELFFHSLLCHGRLADALPALVSVLCDTVPVLEVLVHILARAIPKAAGWWRVMFSPDGSVARHALDFRVLTGTRMALFDASQSLFCSAPQSQQQDNKSGTPVGFVMTEWMGKVGCTGETTKMTNMLPLSTSAKRQTS